MRWLLLGLWLRYLFRALSDALIGLPLIRWVRMLEHEGLTVI